MLSYIKNESWKYEAILESRKLLKMIDNIDTKRNQQQEQEEPTSTSGSFVKNPFTKSISRKLNEYKIEWRDETNTINKSQQKSSRNLNSPKSPSSPQQHDSSIFTFTDEKERTASSSSTPPQLTRRSSRLGSIVSLNGSSMDESNNSDAGSSNAAYSGGLTRRPSYRDRGDSNMSGKSLIGRSGSVLGLNDTNDDYGGLSRPRVLSSASSRRISINDELLNNEGDSSVGTLNRRKTSTIKSKFFLLIFYFQ